MDPWSLFWCATDPPAHALRVWRAASPDPSDMDGDEARALASWLCVDSSAVADVVARRIATGRDQLEHERRRWGDAHIEEPSAFTAAARSALSSPWAVVAGQLPRPGAPAIAIVGTRALPPDVVPRARRFIERLVRELHLPVVSGGALGIDRMAHDAALQAGVPAFIALAGGLAHAGPAAHRDAYRRIVATGGALITQRPPGAEPRRFEFVRRNRLIAALASVVVVVRAPAESGALATARHAASIGRPVLVVPGEFDAPDAAGCHALLADGAGICTGPDDVRRALGAPRPLAAQVPLAVPTRVPDDAVGAALVAGPVALDDLVDRTGLPVREVSARLVLLELDGSVRRGPDGRWMWL